MQMKIDGSRIKEQSPARVTTKVEVVKLEEGEEFNEATLGSIAMQIYENEKFFFEMMNFEGHQTFRAIFSFTYGDQKKDIMLFPCYTKNF